MSQILGIGIQDGEIRQVPKLGLNMKEVVFCYGSHQLVIQLRDIEALIPIAGGGRTQLFDRDEVVAVWARYRNGEYTNQLQQLRR